MRALQRRFGTVCVAPGGTAFCPQGVDALLGVVALSNLIHPISCLNKKSYRTCKLRTYQHQLKIAHVQIGFHSIIIICVRSIGFASSFQEFGLADTHPFRRKIIRCSSRARGCRCRRTKPALKHAGKPTLGERLAPISGLGLHLRWWRGVRYRARSGLLGCPISIFFLRRSHIVTCLGRKFRLVE